MPRALDHFFVREFGKFRHGSIFPHRAPRWHVHIAQMRASIAAGRSGAERVWTAPV